MKHLPDTVLGVFDMHIQSLEQSCEIVTLVIFILQMRKQAQRSLVACSR